MSDQENGLVAIEALIQTQMNKFGAQNMAAAIQKNLGNELLQRKSMMSG